MKSSGVPCSALGAAIAISLALLISGVRISPFLLFSLGGSTVFLFAENPLIMVHHHAGLSSLGMPVGTGVLTLFLVAFLWSRARPGKKYPVLWRQRGNGETGMSLKERIARFDAARRRPPERVPRWKAGAAVNVPVAASFCTPGPKGYTDYPASRR